MRMDKLTSKFQTALADAQSLAVGRDHQFIEPAHLMTALLDQQGGTVRHLLSQINRDNFVTATVVTSYLEADDALRMVASAFRLPFEQRDKASLLRQIEDFLVSRQYDLI